MMESLISEREGLVFQDIQELIPSSVSYQSSRRASGPNHPATDSFTSSTLSVTPSKSESNLAVRLGRRLKGSFKDTKSLGSGLHKFMSVSLLPGASSSDELNRDLERTGQFLYLHSFCYLCYFYWRKCDSFFIYTLKYASGH